MSRNTPDPDDLDPTDYLTVTAGMLLAIVVVWIVFFGLPST